MSKHDILTSYGINPNTLLGQGMEAETYAYGPDSVFKIYTNTSHQHMRKLQEFYQTVDRERVPFGLPHIYSVNQEAGHVVAIERRLTGTPLQHILPTLAPAQLDAAMQRYLSAALALGLLQMPPHCERYKLFDDEHISQRSAGDWHQFLARFLDSKLVQVQNYLMRDVPHFTGNLQRLRTLFEQPYTGEYRLIHGDFFPGNLLVNQAHEISALLDFGVLTMYGDQLFDLATSWVFFDMYDQLQAHIRERYLALLIERLGEQARGRLYRYVLFYSIVSANSYSSTCSDGHYQWCVANLTHRAYWDGLE